jgi:hypothetical protein
MATRTKAKRDPIVRIQEAVDELFFALHELDVLEQFRELAPYVDADTVDNVIHLLSIIMEGPVQKEQGEQPKDSNGID